MTSGPRRTRTPRAARVDAAELVPAPGTQQVDRETTSVIDELKADLLVRQRETFRVHAVCRDERPLERFLYVEVQRTAAP